MIVNLNILRRSIKCSLWLGAGMLCCLALWANLAKANQQYEELSDSTKGLMGSLVNDQAVFGSSYRNDQQFKLWLREMSKRLLAILPQNSILQDKQLRDSFLTSLHYEATRTGLDPQLVLSIIHVESAFRKYAISHAGARGYMQVMPFWSDLIGDTTTHNLFHLRVNLRYGTVILRHYLDIEKGDYFRALGRYNGSLGKARYPNLVWRKWQKHWLWQQ